MVFSPFPFLRCARALYNAWRIEAGGRSRQQPSTEGSVVYGEGMGTPQRAKSHRRAPSDIQGRCEDLPKENILEWATAREQVQVIGAEMVNSSR